MTSQMGTTTMAIPILACRTSKTDLLLGDKGFDEFLPVYRPPAAMVQPRQGSRGSPLSAVTPLPDGSCRADTRVVHLGVVSIVPFGSPVTFQTLGTGHSTLRAGTRRRITAEVGTEILLSRQSAADRLLPK
jgi:hypothetical protein